MTQLPLCEYRVVIDEQTVFFCRHTKVRAVGGFVAAEVCGSCVLCSVPCTNPRPIPELQEAAAESQPAIHRTLPPLRRQLWNAAVSLAEFVADGFHTVTEEQYAERLAICENCPERQDTRCVRCGCNLALKARGRVFKCPLDKWPSVAGE